MHEYIAANIIFRQSPLKSKGFLLMENTNAGWYYKHVDNPYAQNVNLTKFHIF